MKDEALFVLLVVVAYMLLQSQEWSYALWSDIIV